MFQRSLKLGLTLNVNQVQNLKGKRLIGNSNLSLKEKILILSQSLTLKMNPILNLKASQSLGMQNLELT